MAEGSAHLVHVLGGGLASDFGTLAPARPSSGVVTVPYLLEADNVLFLLDGGFRQIGGTQKINSVALGAGVDSIYDFWFGDGMGTIKQRRVVYSGQSIRFDKGDGVFQILSTSFADDSKVFFAQFDDDLIVSSISPSDAPRVWNGGSLELLGSNTPNFGFGAVWKNRFWAAGDITQGSKLYYSPTLPDGPRGDWAGADAGEIDIGPGDGDDIQMLVPYKNRLFVFKGPHKGSIHYIEGDSPSDFARRDFLNDGLPTIAPNGWFLYRDDVGFITASGSIHGLQATASFGDFTEAALSAPIDELLRTRINRNALFRCDATDWDGRGKALLAVPFDGSPKPNVLLCMDHRFQTPRWSVIDAFDCSALSKAVDPQRAFDVTVLIGGTDRFVRRIDQADFSIDGSTAYTARISTPVLQHGTSKDRFNLQGVGMYTRPDGKSTPVVRWQRDGQPAQSLTMDTQGGDLLGTTFVLGTSTLGGGEQLARMRRAEDGGEFNVIRYEIESATLNHGLEVHGFETVLQGSSEAWEQP